MPQTLFGGVRGWRGCHIGRAVASTRCSPRRGWRRLAARHPHL